MAKPHTMKWYKERDEEDEKLRSKLLKGTKRKSGESALEWLTRVNESYMKRTKIK